MLSIVEIKVQGLSRQLVYGAVHKRYSERGGGEREEATMFVCEQRTQFGRSYIGSNRTHHSPLSTT